MKKIFKIWLLLAVFGAVSLAAAGVALNSGIIGFSPNASENALRLPKADKSDIRDEEGNYLERRDWFLQQRLYGSDEIPAEARRRAKDTADAVAPQLSDSFSPDAGWTLIGPQPVESAFQAAYGNVSGRINFVAVHPTNNDIVLLASSTGGIWRSTNALADPNGATPPVYLPVSDSQVDLAVGAIAFDPSNPSNVYATMGDHDNSYLGTGVLKSTDAGASWTRLTTTGLPDKGFGINIAVNANAPNTIYLARGLAEGSDRTYPTLPQTGGFYRSTDGGSVWTQTLNGKVTSFVVSPTNQNRIYATVLDSGQAGAVGKGIYLSTDGGQNFAIATGAPDLLDATDFRAAISQIEPNRIYFFGGKEKPAPAKLHVAVDTAGALAWTSNTIPFNQFDTEQFNYNTYLVADPFTAGRLYIGSRDIFRVTVNNSNNVGLVENLSNAFFWNGTEWSFQPAMAKCHSDQQHLAFGGSAATFFAAHDGGLQLTTDTGATFTKNLNNSLGLSQIIGLAIHPTDVTKAYIGTQDNGTQRRVTGTQWKEFVGGDGGMIRLDPVDPSRVFTSYTQGEITRVDADGTAAQVIVNPSKFGTNRRTPFYPAIVTNGVDSALYVGADTLAVCTNCATVNGTGNWTFPANGNGADLTRGDPDTLSAIGVQKTAYNNTQAIYTGSAKGAFNVSQDGGATFVNRTGLLDNAVHNGSIPVQNPGRYITSIKVDPTTAGTAYITVSGFGTQHVFKSTNFGMTIAPLNFTVDIPTNDFLVDPVTATTFFIGTDIGVFRSGDAGATWNQYSPGLPPVIVNRLDGSVVTSFAMPPATRIVAGTYGRGVFQINAGATAASVTVAGRIRQTSGRGIGNVRVTLTAPNGEIRYALSNFAGYYRFNDVSAGSGYVFEASSKRWQFADNPRLVTISEETEELNFSVGK